MSYPDVIKEHQVLMNLTHITHMRYHGNIEFFAHQADGNIFRHATHPYRIRLIKADGP